MKKRQINVYHVVIDGEVVLSSRVELTVRDLLEYYWFDQSTDWSIEAVSRDVPFEVGRTEIWSGGGDDVPHIHYACSHCGEEHNFDLDATDPNPRLAFCEELGAASYTLVEWSAHRVD